MGTIRARVPDELEKRLEEKVEEIKKKTPLGAEVNNSTVIRGALVDFFEKIDKERKGEKNISFYPNQFSNKELSNIENAIDKLIENLDSVLTEDKAGYWFIFDLLTFVSNQLAFEVIERKKRKKGF